MMRKFILFSLACVLLTACSIPNFRSEKVNQSVEKQNDHDEEVELKQLPPADIMIASIGDSLTQGVGDETNKGGYQSILATRLEEEKRIKDISMAHYGKRGLTSEGLVEKLHQSSMVNLVKQADVVIVTIGGNDVMDIVKKNYKHLQLAQFEKGMKQYEKNVNEILAIIRKNNPKGDIYLVGLYNPFDKWLNSVDEFNDIMIKWNEKSKNIASKHKGVYFVEISPIFSSKKENLIYEEDYFHPNTKGYEKMGNAIYEALKQNTILRMQQQAMKSNS
ncbi:SGNH/GDSL hydrolase family protein [Bacillus massiliigorillae]|uniref:SGNH/GDSL hydrolase family protein n=1 Tax=Bacillus massiliigorillae TaxID=1243664 RepID=UPI000399FDB9|nr:SGNH/GDSL hydrolase family protein [Bacillus massiliigorillae]